MKYVRMISFYSSFKNHCPWVHAWMPRIVQWQVLISQHLLLAILRHKAFVHLPKFNWGDASSPMESFLVYLYYLRLFHLHQKLYRLLKNVMLQRLCPSWSQNEQVNMSQNRSPWSRCLNSQQLDRGLELTVKYQDRMRLLMARGAGSLNLLIL